MSEYQVECVAKTGCVLGEGVLWDDENGYVWWVDIKNPAIWRYDCAAGGVKSWKVAERIGFIARKQSGGFIGGMKSGLFDITLEKDRAITRLRVDYQRDGDDDRINDGYVDGKGRLWFGTMDDREVASTGWLNRHDRADEVIRCDGPYVVTNGPCVSPDGKILYHVDSWQRLISAFSVDEGGNLSNKRDFVRFLPEWGFPDGVICDGEGFVWAGHWAGSRLTRFTPTGEVDRVIAFPVSKITKCVFGGPDLMDLYVTSAALATDPAKEPLAGGLFRVKTDIKGWRGISLPGKVVLWVRKSDVF